MPPSSSPFGAAPRDRPLEFGHAFVDIEGRLRDEIPGFFADQSAVVMASVCILHALPSQKRISDHSISVVTTQAFNDFFDLLDSLGNGRGRPASHAARALIEHLANLADLIRSEEARRRYNAHLAVANQLEAEAAIGLNRLSGVERRVYEHKLRKLRSGARRSAEAAVRQYGRDFVRGWAADNLRSRLSSFGWADLYDYYRLASTVLHGAPGGAHGVISYGYEQPVHRLGPAITLCVPAYLEGISAFRLLIVELGSIAPTIDMSQILLHLDDLTDHWPVYRRYVLKLDRELWPKGEYLGMMAVCAISRSGVRRWYLHYSQLRLLIPAEPPASDQLSDDLMRTLEYAETQAQKVLTFQDQWVTIACEAVHLNPLPGGVPIPEASILPPKKTA